MAHGQVQYGGGEVVKTKRVFYNGSTALKARQPVCYVEDAKIFLPEDADGFSSSTNTADRGLSRGVQVETPATASLKFFAGIVDPADAGKSGGEWITILVPQNDEVIEVRVEGTTDIAVGDGLEVTDGNAYLTKDASETFDLTIFRALEAFTDNAEGTILAKRLT
jgi:hypothetical protein